MADVSVLEVLLNGKEIGTLTQVGGDRNLFAFNEQYINNPNRPTLSLSFKDSLGELITDIRPTQTKVPPFFANLLPEGPMREYLAERAGVSASRDFFLLWVLGRDLPGGVVVRPSDGDAWPPEDNHVPDDDSEREPALRFSLAGVQLKFSAVMEATGGLTVPVEGIGGSWIIKLPSTKWAGVPENEFAMMTLARHAGMDIPEVRLIPLDEIAGLPKDIVKLQGKALAVKRFDRTDDGGSIHIEDFAQVFGVYPDRKYSHASYKNIAEVIWAEVGEEGVKEFVRRVVFNTLIGNADMHLKNWSLIYPDGRHAALAPGYDFVSTIPYLEDEKMALNYIRSKKMSDLTLDELAYFAAKARLPENLVIDTALETVDLFHEVWDQEKLNLPITKAIIEKIENNVKTVPLYTEQRK
jgi:serine/threonine-protein kinase HipA